MASLRTSPFLRLANGLRRIPKTASRQQRWASQSNDIEGMLNQKSKWESFDPQIRKLAVFAEHARAHNYQIPLLSKAQTGTNVTFNQDKAYHVAAAIRQLREMNGEIVAGRKIGFTNKNIWPEYGIDESNWSYMYQNTIVDLPAKEELEEGKVVMANISHLNAMEPKIEPEIVLGLRSVPEVGMSDLEVLGCIEWIGHGFEIVASVFPHWKFTAADTTAAFALHGLLLCGSRKLIFGKGDGVLLKQLEDFEVQLLKDGEVVDEGRGSNVLGSPVRALKHLVELLASDRYNRPLEAGEIITTGTLTRALTIKNGEHWSTRLKGIDLPGLDVRFRT